MANWVIPYQANDIINTLLAGQSFSLGWATQAVTCTRQMQTLPGEDSGGSPAYARATCTVVAQTIAQTNDTLSASGQLTSNGNKTIYGMAVFHSSGKVFMLVDFTPIPIGTGKSISFVGQMQGL